MNDAQDGETREGREVGEGFPRSEATPAFVTADEDSVGDEEEEGEPVREACGERRAVEAQFEGVDEEVVEGSVER